MIYLMIIALMLNLNMTVYFFEIPYQVIEIGGSQMVVSMLSVIHSIVYVLIAGIYSNMKPSPLNSIRKIKILLVCLVGIYTISCFIQNYHFYYILILLHGICLGFFWPIFWSGFYGDSTSKPLLLSTTFICVNAANAVGPSVAGLLYDFCGKYILLILSLVIILLLFFHKQLNAVFSTNNVKVIGISQKSKTYKFKVRNEITKKDWIKLIFFGWLTVFLTGYLEGIIRSAAAIYFLKYEIGSNSWGSMQSLKLLFQSLIVIWIRYHGEALTALLNTKRKILLCFGILAMGSGIMVIYSSVPILCIGMSLIGIASGLIYFVNMYVGIQATEVLGKNLNGIAESVIGIGILISSLVSGLISGNPFRMLTLLSLVAIITVSIGFRKEIWEKIS